MSYAGNLKAGDRVRVTFEGTVSDVDAPGFGVESSGDYKSHLTKWFGPRFIEDTGLTVEKIEPPVEQFKPGDVLKEIGGTTLIALGQEGYIYLNNFDPGEHFKYNEGVPLSYFTAKHYERVELP